MRPLKRDFALGIGLKLNSLNRLRFAVKIPIKCCNCLSIIEKNNIYFAEFAYRELPVPIDMGNMLQKKIPFVYQKWCIPCSKKYFKQFYKLERKGE